MPTGYTYSVCNGEVTEFSEFAMQCARAFGACISLRDEPSDTPIPDEFKPSDYNEKRLAECRARLAEIEAMTPEQVEVAAQADYDAAKARRDKYEAEQKLSDQRIDRMLERVAAWSPPTAEHIGLKDFMIEQLTMSKRGSYRSDEPKQLSAAEWQREQIKKLHDEIGYHAAEQAKEIERTRGRTEWVRKLRGSLSPQTAANAAA